MNIGRVIKERRIQRKMTQEQLALEADIATSNVSRIEKGLRQPSQKLLIKLAKALNTTPSILYASCEQLINGDTDNLVEEKTSGIDINQLMQASETQYLLKLFSELNPSNKHLLLEQLKVLHAWQSKN